MNNADRLAKWEVQHAREMQHVQCRIITARAIKRGVIQRQPCEVCKTPGAQAHHADYNKPLEIIWLCEVHHRAEHKKIMSQKSGGSLASD